MKYCVSGRQQRIILSKADEIKMLYKDRERLIDYISDFSDKIFIVQIPKEDVLKITCNSFHKVI